MRTGRTAQSRAFALAPNNGEILDEMIEAAHFL
jgi:hypothetical protein